MYNCIVVRPIEGANGQKFKPGEVVDAEGWHHLPKLMQLGRLRPVTGSASDLSEDISLPKVAPAPEPVKNATA